MVYHIYINAMNQTTIWYMQGNTRYSFVVTDPANTDYANFKKEILADEAQLQDADGNTMTANKAKGFVATLP
jgi:hypothetical protein